MSNKEVPVDFLQGIFVKFVAEIGVRSGYVVEEKSRSSEKLSSLFNLDLYSLFSLL